MEKTEDKVKKAGGPDPEIEELFPDEGTREFLKSLKRLTRKNLKFVEGITGLFFEEEPSGGKET